jgi:hypothetical protein
LVNANVEKIYCGFCANLPPHVPQKVPEDNLFTEVSRNVLMRLITSIKLSFVPAISNTIVMKGNVARK